MSILTFPRAEVIALFADARKHHGAGTMEYFGEKKPPMAMLVGDQGVYLMHNQAKSSPGKDTARLVVYARECDPTTMAFDDWWEAKEDTFGGDDGSELLDWAAIEAGLAGGTDLRIEINATTLEILT